MNHSLLSRAMMMAALSATVAIATVAPSVRASTPRIQFNPPEIERPQVFLRSSYMSHGGPRCGNNYTHALIPPTQVGLTDGSNPILFFHVDRRTAQNMPTTIALQLELFPLTPSTEAAPLGGIAEAPLYTSTIQVPVNVLPGIIGFRLPDLVNQQLQTDRFYQWVLQIACRPDLSDPFFNSDPYDSDYISGLLHPVERDPKLAAELAQAASLRQVALYAQNGIWYESLSLLAQLRQAEPENQALKAAWTNLLESAGFGSRYRLPPKQLADSPLWF